MKRELQPGLVASRRITVDRARTIDFLGDTLRVYATPCLIEDFESTCRDFLLQYVDAGEDSVGTEVSVTHSGATLLGMSVDISVTVAEVNGRHVAFELVARDGAEEISRGRHSRFLVGIARLRERVAAKAQRL